MSKRVFSMLAVALLLISCSANNGRSYVETEMTETLEVEILPNTSKMFVYRLRWPEPKHDQVGIVQGGGNRGPHPGGGVKLGRDTHERLLVNTAYVVEHSGYCREGFFELDRRISPMHLWVRGECKDGATDADRQAFGTKQTLTPERWRNPSQG
jgi:hypothetical protein